MSRHERVLERVLTGASDRNIRFEELHSLILALGFDERVRGSHHIFTRLDVEEILNLQPSTAGMAKPYQVKQVRTVLVKYKITG